MIKQINDQCAASIATFKRYYQDGPIQSVTLHPDIRAQIDKTVKSAVENLVAEGVEAAFKKVLQDGSITARIEQRFTYYTDDLVKTKVREHLETIKAKL